MHWRQSLPTWQITPVDQRTLGWGPVGPPKKENKVSVFTAKSFKGEADIVSQ